MYIQKFKPDFLKNFRAILDQIFVWKLLGTVQSAKRLYPSRSRSNKKRIKFLAKPTQTHAKSSQNPRYFHAYFSLWQRELREISRLFHV